MVKERQVHRVHHLIIVKLQGLPILMMAEEFKKYCEECFTNTPLASAELKMAVLSNTAFSKRKLPQLEKEFVRYVEKVVVDERGEMLNDCAYFGKMAKNYMLDFLEVNRWFYRKFSYTLDKVEGHKDHLLTVTTYGKAIVPLPQLLRQKHEVWRFFLEDIETLVGAWWDFRFSNNDVDWYRIRKGDVFQDREFDFLPENL